MKNAMIIGILLLIVLTAGCTSTGGTTGGTNTGGNNNGGGTVGETKSFDITAQRFSFSPSTITVNQGDTVVLHITSQDVTHGFSLPEFGVSEILNQGSTVNVTFVADKKGTFTFACNNFCGDGHTGMKGTLIVQ